MKICKATGELKLNNSPVLICKTINQILYMWRRADSEAVIVTTELKYWWMLNSLVYETMSGGKD